MIRGLDHMGTAVVNGKIITVGGFTARCTPIPRPSSMNTIWPPTLGANSPDESTTRFGRRRGSRRQGPRHRRPQPAGMTVTTHEVYDPATNSWSDAAPLPKARDHMAVVAAEGKIHAIGGRFTSPVDRTGEHDIYDPGPMPGPRRRRCRRRAAGSHRPITRASSWCSAANCRRKTARSTKTKASDVAAGAWRALAPMPEAGTQPPPRPMGKPSIWPADRCCPAAARSPTNLSFSPCRN